MRRSAPTVVKLGGSHAFSDHLPGWVEAIAGRAGNIIIVPGGGPFADAVRDAQPRMGFGDGAAHHMALLAMEQYGCALAALDRRLVLADSLDAIGRALEAKRVPVWMPSRMVLAAADVPHSWDVTSDSLAAWLAGKVGARQLLLVKHIGSGDKTLPLHELVARGIVDKAFADFLDAAGVPAVVLGSADRALLPEIVGHRETDGLRIGS
jgi:dihydroneopterin aldolase